MKSVYKIVVLVGMITAVHCSIAVRPVIIKDSMPFLGKVSQQSLRPFETGLSGSDYAPRISTSMISIATAVPAVNRLRWSSTVSGATSSHRPVSTSVRP
jgi:hypothetical protein